MNSKKTIIQDSQEVLEELTKTLLYEGYALFPYHRTAVKNQKPMPIGVIYPEMYHVHNKHAFSNMQSQSIVTVNNTDTVSISIRFLHFKKIDILQSLPGAGKSDPGPVPVLTVNNKTYQTGWQTVERKIGIRALSLEEISKKTRVIPIHFEKERQSNDISNEEGLVVAQQVHGISEIKGRIEVGAALLKTTKNAFKITVNITNTTPVEDAAKVTRDEVYSLSFLSTHIVLESEKGTFISHQDPEDEWKMAIHECKNIHTWPILIDKKNTTLLSSPIIVYDHPEINPQSPVNLFDSTEIEEALVLHVAVMSDEEKKRIGQSDEKLQAMLQKVGEVTPEELIKLHGGLKRSGQE